MRWGGGGGGGGFLAPPPKKNTHTHYKELVTHTESHAQPSKSARERRIALYKSDQQLIVIKLIVQELCESRGGRPGLSVLTSLLVSVDVKIY